MQTWANLKSKLIILILLSPILNGVGLFLCFQQYFCTYQQVVNRHPLISRQNKNDFLVTLAKWKISKI